MKYDDIKNQTVRLSIYDYFHIIKLAKKLKSTMIDTNEEKLKIAVIGSCSIQHFVMVLRLFLLKYNIIADIIEGDYNGINKAVYEDQSALYKFRPDIVIILSDYRDIHDMPDLLAKRQIIDDFLLSQKEYFQKLWACVSRIHGCHIFQSNYVMPIERELGNLEANVEYSKRTMYSMLNLELMKNKPSYVTIIDMEYIASLVGKENWFDYTLYFTSKIAYSMKYIGFVCDVYAQQIAALQGKMRKCLVLDLDNTLWGGVAAEEGFYGINIDPNNAVGEAYRNFQQYILNLKNKGVILAVISKNDYHVVKEVFDKNYDMILKFNDFSSFIANWDNKAINIDRVAKELNIGTDSLVFFDDNPSEREIIKMYHPEVLVIEVPENVANYTIALECAHPFEWISLTEEDIGRVDSYRNNLKRDDLKNQFCDYQKYLIALNMKGKVEILKGNNIQRFVQLINKANQFNVRTKRYSEALIEDMLFDDNYRLVYATLEDRFSKFGIISCVILKKDIDNCFIDTWVMSCRVLKRDVEKMIFKKIIKVAEQWECDKIVGEYIPTSKNGFVKSLYSELGFSVIEKEKDKRELYEYNLKVESSSRELLKNIVIIELE